MRASSGLLRHSLITQLTIRISCDAIFQDDSEVFIFYVFTSMENHYTATIMILSTQACGDNNGGLILRADQFSCAI